MPRRKNILVVSDNFLIGGREAYISTCLRELCSANDFQGQHGLLTSLFDPGTPQGHCFSSVATVTDPQNIDEWLRKAEQVVAEMHADVIWVHHYAILPALRIALKHRLPLVVTLHGAPLSQGILREKDSLGLVLALQAGATLTVVSEEIETIERAALEDLNAAAKETFGAELGMHSGTIGTAYASVFGALPASAIVVNRVIGLGLSGEERSETIDAIVYGPLGPDESYGRNGDGAQDWVVFTETTPDAMNVPLSLTEYSLLHGVYPNPTQGEVRLSERLDLRVHPKR